MRKIIFITGATSGIGKAVFEKFAAQNWDCIIVGRRVDILNKLAQEFSEKYPISIYPMVMDVQNKHDVFEKINALPKEWQNVDICFNNAGLALGKDSFDNADLKDWETMIDTNFKGVLYVSKAILPFMISNKKGYFINMGSTAAKEVYSEGNVYCASKSAIDVISKAMRIDLLPHNIKVSCIHPGAVDTEFSKIRFKGNQQMADNVYKGFLPLFGNDIADIVWYLANTPNNVCINDLTVTCIAQAGAHYILKNNHIK